MLENMLSFGCIRGRQRRANCIPFLAAIGFGVYEDYMNANVFGFFGRMYQKYKPSPLAQVTFRDKTQSTKTQKSTNTPRWNEELVWEKVTVGGPLEPTFPLAVQVFSEGWGVGRPSLVGSALHEMSASALRDGVQELVLNLEPKKGKPYASAGKVRVRIWMGNNSDKGGASARVEADDRPGDDEGDEVRPGDEEGGDEVGKMVLPDDVPCGDWGITVCVLEAKDIRTRDPNGCCANVTVKCGDEAASCKAAPKGISAVWHETFQFRAPIASPLDFQVA